MTFRKWFFLFWSCLLVGAVVCAIVGSLMSWLDPNFGYKGLEIAGFNALMMALVGLMFGAFAQMGFFAYLTLNYIALSVFRKRYLWTALQGYTTIFAILGLGYMLYEQRQNNWFFWLLPLLLLLISLLGGFLKVQQTNKTAFIPTVFLLFFVTFIESWPALQGDTNMGAILFMMLPLYACNLYQVWMMHRLTGGSEQAAKATVGSEKTITT